MDAAQLLMDNGYDDVMILTEFSFDDALIGVTEDNRAVYDYEKMVRWLMENQGVDGGRAADWIECNTLRALPYKGENAPIIMYPLIR